MAGLFTRRAFTAVKIPQPSRLKSWCSRENDNADAKVKSASQESLYKDYDIKHCKKTVFLCPTTRLDCDKQKSPPRGSLNKSGENRKQKATVTDTLGKIVWFFLKGGVVISLVCFTRDVGVWKGSDQTYDLAKTMHKRILEVLDLDDSRMATAAEVKYSMVQAWNKGVRFVVNKIADPASVFERFKNERESSE